MARISVTELNDLLINGNKPVILDTRAPQLIEDGWIPGALFTSLDSLDGLNLDLKEDEPVILYCSCPNEVTAAKVAKALMAKGYHNVKPLAGGIEAWRAAGYETTVK